MYLWSDDAEPLAAWWERDGRWRSADERDVVRGQWLAAGVAHQQGQLPAMLAAVKNYLKQHVFDRRLECEPRTVVVRHEPLQLVGRARVEKRA